MVKITEYPNTVTQLENGDLIDISKDLGGSNFESQKMDHDDLRNTLGLVDTAHYIMKYATTADRASKSVINQDTTAFNSIGINKASPEAQLHVNVEAGASGPNVIFKTTRGGAVGFYHQKAGSSLVGIATSSPLASVHVGSLSILLGSGLPSGFSASLGKITIAHSSSSTTFDVAIASHSTNFNAIRRYDESGAATREAIGMNLTNNSQGLSFATGDTTDLYTTAGCVGMILDSSKNVSVGFASSLLNAARLHVRGQNDLLTHYGIRIENQSGTPAFRVRNDLIILMENLPTSAAGLPSGALWNDVGTLKVA